MRLSDYDPDNPPRATHKYEADRLFGRGVGRAITAGIILALVGYRWWSPETQFMTQPILMKVLIAILLLRAAWPLLQGLEHTLVMTRKDIRNIRGSSKTNQSEHD